MPAYDPRYLAYFDHFNRQEYFEAHEVLEGLWLETRDDRRDFYKGLIQTAAVFLKLQQQKPAPAARLAGRARALLAQYEPEFEGLDVRAVRRLLRHETRPEPPPHLMPEMPCD
jgi:predicted metal-dependent hydrolase